VEIPEIFFPYQMIIEFDHDTILDFGHYHVIYIPYREMLGTPNAFQRDGSKLTWLSHVGFYEN